MQLNLKIGNNLFLQGNKVISYETHVADIEGESVQARGKYSSTTSKQMHRLASLLRLKLHVPNKKQDFYRHEYGAKFYIDDCLSEKISLYIVSYLRERGLDYTECNSNDLLPMLRKIPNVGPKDWRILCEYLNLSSDTPTPQQQEKDEFNALKILLAGMGRGPRTRTRETF